MDSSISLRIDSPIQPMGWSYICLLAVWVVVNLGFLWLLPLAWWQVCVWLIITGFIIWLVLLQKPKVIHLTEPAFSRHFQDDWLLYVKTTLRNEIWHAKLVYLRAYGSIIILSFKVHEPFYRTVYLVLYYNQMPSGEWHKLKILAHNYQL